MNDLSLHLIDIIQNSLSAGADTVYVKVEERTADDLLVMEIRDNGRGMSADQIERLSDPFFTTRTTRRIGMGIPLLKQSAEQSGGGLEITSVPGTGTNVRAVFGLSHIDRPPMGDIGNSFMLMVSANPEHEFVLDYRVDNKQYVFDTREIKEALEGVPLNEPSVIRLLSDMIAENLKDLKVRA